MTFGVSDSRNDRIKRLEPVAPVKDHHELALAAAFAPEPIMAYAEDQSPDLSTVSKDPPACR